MLRTARRLTTIASNTGTQIEKSPVTTVISVLTTSSPPMILATPESELELRMQILSDVTTFSTGKVAWNAYWPSLFAVPCVIVPLAFVAKGSDQAAEHVVC